MQWHKTEGLHQNCVQAQVLYGPNSGNKVLIPRVKLVPSDINLPFTLERNQLATTQVGLLNDNKGQTFGYICQNLFLYMVSYMQLFHEQELSMMSK